MATVLQIVGYLSIPVLLVSVGLTIRSIRRERAVTLTVRSAAIPILFVATSLVGYIAFIGVATSALTTWLPLLGGIVAGLWWNRATTRLTVREGRVVGVKTAWVLLPWALSITLTQSLALAESSLTVPVGFTLLFTFSGLVIGEQMGLLQRRAELLGRTPPVAPAAAVLLIAFLVIGLPGVAAAADYSFEKVANGEEPYVTVELSGSGQGYYGDSISAFFTNNTGRTITVEVGSGLQLVPRDSSVQTMLTVGQTIEVPPGGHSRLIKAFCGEMHDRAPGAGDTFDVRGEVDDPALVRALEEMRRRDLGDSREGQDLVWHFRDGYDISGNPAAQELLDATGRAPTRENAGKSGAAVAVIGGGLAGGLAGTDKRRLLTGPHALKQLTLRGATVRTIPTVDTETGITTDKVFVVPPDEIPPDAEAISFTTRDIVDPTTGESVTVIDDRQEVQVLMRPLLPPQASEPTVVEAPPPAPEEAPVATGPVKKIEDDEVERIVDWGVKNNRSPEDIQRDVDERNESLGGNGPVVIPEPPQRITLPQGEVTLSPAEHAEYLQRAKRMADLLDNARIYREAMEKLAGRARFWSAVDKAVVVRWIAGTKQIYDQGLIMNDPGPSLARKGGFDSVEDMLVTGYGKPTWTSFDTRRHGSLTEAIEAWKQEQGGGWSQYQADRARAMQEARDKLQTMLAPTRKTGETPTLPERVFVGPNVEVPTELLPTKSPAVNKMSWYNRPAHELSRILKAQQQGQQYLRGVRTELQQFLEYEADLARRIPTPGP